MTISVEELRKVKDFVLKQVTKENRCLVLGTEDMIDRFCHDTGVRIDYVMVDVLNIDNEIESIPVKMYNPKSKQVFMLSITDRGYLINTITHSRQIDGESTTEDLKYLLGVELVKKRYRDGYQFSADVMCADSEKKKIDMIDRIFRIPPEQTINDMRTLLEDKSIIELDKRFDSSVKQNPRIHQIYANERLCETLEIDDNRFEELRQILLKLSKLSIGSGSMDDITDIDHEMYLDLLEKEEGISHRERLYLAFSEGSILQQLVTEFNEKIPSLEEDRDERIKSIGKRYSCEITKSLTLSKINNLGGLNLREKLKSSFWTGVYNNRFYGKENCE